MNISLLYTLIDNRMIVSFEDKNLTLSEALEKFNKTAEVKAREVQLINFDVCDSYRPPIKLTPKMDAAIIGLRNEMNTIAKNQHEWTSLLLTIEKRLKEGKRSSPPSTSTPNNISK